MGKVAVLLICLCLLSPSQSSSDTLWDFDDSGNTGTTWTGWQWYGTSDASPNGGTGANGYGDPGWLKAPTYAPHPTAFRKDDYGNVTAAEFITSPLPVAASYSALRVYDTDAGDNKQAAWLFWREDSFGELGLADANTNRVSFYAYITGIDASDMIAGTNGNANFEFSTYLIWPDGSCGDPNEACNQHYYHYFNANSGAWIHFQPDNRPTWQRNTDVPVVEPAGVEHPYFYSMDHFYIQTGQSAASGSSFTVGDIIAWGQTEPESTDICNIWVGYWPATEKWEIGLSDCAIYYTSGSSVSAVSKFEARWSTSPITNANWSSANTITPEYHRFESTNSFRRSNDWYQSGWTRFDLPAGVEAANNTLYFALKDTSLISDGDSRDGGANVKTIDYVIRAATAIHRAGGAPSGGSCFMQ